MSEGYRERIAEYVADRHIEKPPTEDDLRALLDHVDTVEAELAAAQSTVDELKAQRDDWARKAVDRLEAYNRKIQDFAKETRRTSELTARAERAEAERDALKQKITEALAAKGFIAQSRVLRAALVSLEGENA